MNPRLVVGEFECDGCEEIFSDEPSFEVGGPGGWTMCAACKAKHDEPLDPMRGVEFPFAENH